MNNGKTIIQYEDKGRSKFQRLCEMLNYDYENNSDITAHYDGTVHYKGKDYLIEIKDRNIKFKEYPTIMFEEYKNDTLRNAVSEQGADGAFYVCFYDNEAFIYNIYDTEVEAITPVNVTCNRYTAFDGGRVEKPVKLLPKGISCKYTLND